MVRLLDKVFGKICLREFLMDFQIYGQRDHAVGRDGVDEADTGSLRHGRSPFVIGFARPGFESCETLLRPGIYFAA